MTNGRLLWAAVSCCILTIHAADAFSFSFGRAKSSLGAAANGAPNGAPNGDPNPNGAPNGAPANGISGLAKGRRQSGYSTSSGFEYSRALTKRSRSFVRSRILGGGDNNGDDDETQDEDGYKQMFRKDRPLWKRALSGTARVGKRIIRGGAKEPGTLILVRHGESAWNANKTFTGWADPDLSAQGYREVEHAARLLLEGGYEIDVVFTSRLTRAIRSVWILLQELNEVYLPVFKTWRLNERHYGALTGLSKTETAEQLGHELVQQWRGSLRSRPPPLTPSDQYWPGRNRQYVDLKESDIPLTESLLDCMERTSPVWERKISYELKQGRNVMVVAHANTLRGLVKLIDGIGDDEIQDVAIPTGIPIIYKFDNELNPIAPSVDKQTASQVHMNGLFLEKPGLLKEALKREDDWCGQVPGYNFTMLKEMRPMSPKERSLSKLKASRELGEWAVKFIDPDAAEEDDGTDGSPTYLSDKGTPMQLFEDEVWAEGLHDLEEGQQFDPDYPEFHPSTNKDGKDVLADEEEEVVIPTLIRSDGHPCMKAMPAATLAPGIGSVPIRRDSVIVMIRHGKTEHNKLGLFTGWEDVSLAQDGIDEAKEAGRLLKAHGFEFDVVYTSWLSRAIETAWYVLDELDCVWLPIIKSWRLNERMYGDLTGLSKKMVAQRHGQEQFKAWRRGYKVRPPAVSSFSPNYPGNDSRYVKYMTDVRFSIGETLIRSIEGNKLTLQRKFPKTESLHDCMERTIPYYSEAIVPEAIDEGKRVLISSSENAIRGLLKHLCNIPEEHLTELEIPNGLPLIYDLKSKCLKLLDDGTGQDPLERYNFGKAGKYLFGNCVNEDGTPDEDCDISFISNAQTETNEAVGVVLSEEEKKALDFIRGPKEIPEKIEV